MRDMMGLLVGFQFLGYMMKTGACPQPGDIKNMANAAETALKEVLDRRDRVDDMIDAANRKRDDALRSRPDHG